ncbi:MAG: TRAP transporter small permease [Shewanella sp.]
MKKIINKIMEVMLGSIFIIMLCMTIWQIFSRFILNDPSSFTEEILRFSIIWLVILGSSYATLNDLHFGMTLVSNSLTGMKEKITKLFTLVVTLAFNIGIFVVGGYITAENNMGQTSPILELSIGMIYMVFVISGVMSAVIIILKVIETIFKKVEC